MKKIWVHVRFLLKFIVVQLFGLSVNIYAFIAIVPLYIFMGFSNYLFVWSLIALFFLPIAIVLEGKWNLLWFMLDDGKFNIKYKNIYGTTTFTYELSEDYRTWLDGRSINFITDWLWHNRNRIWNFISMFKSDNEKQYIKELIKNTLILNGKSVELFDDTGFMKYANFAGLKWINKNGDESFKVWSGIKISFKYSIIGTMELYYTKGKNLYYKYSTCFKLYKLWRIILAVLLLPLKFKWLGKKDIWFTYKYHPNDKLGTIHIKFQWEKI